MRLIDEKALINEAATGGWDVDIKELKMILKHVETISDVPVVRGEWIEHEDEMECPQCGYFWNYCDNDTERFNYCPNCGAKMEVEHE